jgi:protein TonB
MVVDFRSGSEKTNVYFIETEVTLTEPPPIYQELPPAVPPSVKKIESAEFTEMIVKEDDDVIEKETVITEEASDTTAEGTAAEGTVNDSQVTGDGATIYSKVDKYPEYPGGKAGLTKYLKDNIEYPRVAKENNIEGTVVVNFVVNVDGSVSDVKIVKSLGGGCDQEALRVVNEMRRWKPGLRGGVPVPVYQNLPIKFGLEQGG